MRMEPRRPLAAALPAPVCVQLRRPSIEAAAPPDGPEAPLGGRFDAARARRAATAAAHLPSKTHCKMHRENVRLTEFSPSCSLTAHTQAGPQN
jgi:hypothetical protein